MVTTFRLHRKGAGIDTRGLYYLLRSRKFLFAICDLFFACKTQKQGTSTEINLQRVQGQRRGGDVFRLGRHCGLDCAEVSGAAAQCGSHCSIQ